MKLIVETTGAFMLLDPYTRDEIDAIRPSVVRATPFIQERTAASQIKVLATDLPEDASDADFLEYWKENKKSAVDAYLSAVLPEPEPKKAAPKKESGKEK